MEQLGMLVCIMVLANVDFTFQKDVKVNKRLLMTDPDVILSRINSLESRLESEKVKISSLENQITNLESDKASMESRITSLEAENTNLRQYLKSVKSPGSTYIRWGRTHCSGPNTELVYTGFAAGQSHYNYKAYSDRWGGPSNMLCLPNNPEINNKTTAGVSLLYGTEFQENIFTANAYDEDVPCSLCRSTNFYTSVMIPGRKSCYNGWNLEYHGILASDHYAHKASTYVCVDSSPEFLQGGKENKDGNLLYATSTQCGSLPCPPYEDNTSINCVVCSK